MAELTVAQKLRRFCHLGSLDPVFIHHSQPAEVIKYFPAIQALCKQLDGTAMLQLLTEVLHNATVVRSDEALFVYAVYLASAADDKWISNLRVAFPELIKGDNDLFLFCKYHMDVQLAQGKSSTFSKTVRKAIHSWYEKKQPSEFLKTWCAHPGKYGFSHQSLLKITHITDKALGLNATTIEPLEDTIAWLQDDEAKTIPSPTPMPVSLQNGYEPQDPPQTESPAQEIPQTPTQLTTEIITNGVHENYVKAQYLNKLRPSSMLIARKLQCTKDTNKALQIIKKFDLNFKQLPRTLLKNTAVMQEFVPKMGYVELLENWPTLAFHDHLKNAQIFQMCRTTMKSREMLRKADVHPLTYLLNIHALGVQKPTKTPLADEKVEPLKVNFIKQLYAQTFGRNTQLGRRMFIAINLNANYRSTHLKNYKSLTYYEAVIALSFAYFKREKIAHVFYFGADKTLEPVPWKKNMNLKDATAVCDEITSTKNTQRLIAPITRAQQDTQVYDLFLTVVPTSAWGNAKNTDEMLLETLDRYRESKTTKAKYIVVNVLKFRNLINHSPNRAGNVLEICGLDRHTTNLIRNFALNQFD